MNTKIFISAGDLSGDIHAANLIKEIKANYNVSVSALGGDKLRGVADVFLKDIVNIGAFGFFPWKAYLILKKVFSSTRALFETNPPDKVILVDYYGFNIHLAKLAKTFNIPVYYYVSPQIWASRRWRAKKIAKCVKKMLTIFPFEPPIYKKYGVNAEFVGNPLIDFVPEPKIKDIDPNNITIGLFPGSRDSAINRHLPVLLETAKIIKAKLGAKFVMFAAKPLEVDLPDYITLDKTGNLNNRVGLDFVICPSGTGSLENALMGLPMAIIYKIAWFNYFLIRAIVTVKYITMVNILADRPVVPEFIQHNATPKKISDFVINEIQSGNYKKTQGELLGFRKMLGDKGVSKRAAKIIMED
jgi:lipid-A-disaccharide synthase